MVTDVHRDSGEAGPSRTGAVFAIAPMAMEVEILVDRLEADLRQDGSVSPELADQLHELRARAERLFA
jgi:hypothetical protein